MISSTDVWVIGWLFSVGYFIPRCKTWPGVLLASICAIVAWPILLGWFMADAMKAP